MFAIWCYRFFQQAVDVREGGFLFCYILRLNWTGNSISKHGCSRDQRCIMICMIMCLTCTYAWTSTVSFSAECTVSIGSPGPDHSTYFNSHSQNNHPHGLHHQYPLMLHKGGLSYDIFSLNSCCPISTFIRIHSFLEHSISH